MAEENGRKLKRTVKDVMFTLYDEEDILHRHDKITGGV